MGTQQLVPQSERCVQVGWQVNVVTPAGATQAKFEQQLMLSQLAPTSLVQDDEVPHCSLGAQELWLALLTGTQQPVPQSLSTVQIFAHA